MVSAAGINTTVTFGAGPNAPNRILVNFTINDDLVALEDLETYNVQLLPPASVVLGAISETSVNILDDDSTSYFHLLYDQFQLHSKRITFHCLICKILQLHNLCIRACIQVMHLVILLLAF